VYAVDVSPTVTKVIREKKPENCEILITDGIHLGVPEGSVDLAFSDQLMEHLHPDDASEQLHNIATALKPSGKYVCITPNRLTGPHDISQYFSKVAEGFHLKEYMYRELIALMVGAGFVQCKAYVGGRGRYVTIFGTIMVVLEFLVRCIPRFIRRLPFVRTVFRGILGITLVAKRK